MYNIREIKLQNQQDCFSWLYLYLAKECQVAYGRSAEGIIYSAVRQFGRLLGQKARKRLADAGRKANLKELAERGADTFLDPRMVIRPLCATEQVLKTETYACPMAYLWRKEGKEQLGAMYCEEFYTGYFDGFSQGKAQTNVSKMMTSDTDYHCKHSVYYRPANVEPKERTKLFSAEEQSANSQARLARPEFPVTESGMVHRCCLLIQCFYRQAAEQKPSDGEAVIAAALEKYGAFLGTWVKQEAKVSEWVSNETFLKMNVPLPLKPDPEGSDRFFSRELQELMEKNCYAAFYRTLEEV